MKQAEEVDQVRAQGVPLAMLVLMYITVMSSAPQLLNSVIEEKMSRISEVLMGAITPFQLMMGKLIGSVGVSVLLAAIYIAGGLVVAQYWGGYASAVTPGALAWFTLFLVMAGLIFGSIFIAIGAACNDLKDTQSMATPAMVLVMLPMFTWMSVLRAPDGMTAAVLSLIPDRGAVSDDAAHLAAARPAGVADRALDRAHGRHRRPRHLGRGEGLPHGTADAGQVGHDGGDVAVGEGQIRGSTGFRWVPQGSAGFCSTGFGSTGFCTSNLDEP